MSRRQAKASIQTHGNTAPSVGDPDWCNLQGRPDLPLESVGLKLESVYMAHHAVLLMPLRDHTGH